MVVTGQQDRGVGHRNCCSRAFTMAESVMCLLIVGIMLVAALHTVGSSAQGRRIQSDRARAEALASQLMTEILKTCYTDPQEPDSWGPDTGETTRSLYDDVDDYDGWYASPLRLSDGTVIDGTDGWTRTVRVRFAALNQPDIETWTETGLVRITVTVRSDLGVTATLVALRSVNIGCNDDWGRESTLVGSVDMSLQLGADGAAVTTGVGLLNEVEGQATSGGSAANTPPTAVAQADTYTGTAPLLVHFSGGASFDIDGNGPVSYSWTFGDGTDAEGQFVQHTFWSPGNYTVTLSVEDEEGATGTVTIAIIVEG